MTGNRGRSTTVCVTVRVGRGANSCRNRSRSILLLQICITYTCTGTRVISAGLLPQALPQSYGTSESQGSNPSTDTTGHSRVHINSTPDQSMCHERNRILCSLCLDRTGRWTYLCPRAAHRECWRCWRFRPACVNGSPVHGGHGIARSVSRIVAPSWSVPQRTPTKPDRQRAVGGGPATVAASGSQR